MTTQQMSTVSTATQDAQWEQRAHAYVTFGSRLSPEERTWQIEKLLPAVIESLRRAADEVNATAGQPIQ